MLQCQTLSPESIGLFKLMIYLILWSHLVLYFAWYRIISLCLVIWSYLGNYFFYVIFLCFAAFGFKICKDMLVACKSKVVWVCYWMELVFTVYKPVSTNLIAFFKYVVSLFILFRNINLSSSHFIYNRTLLF